MFSAKVSNFHEVFKPLHMCSQIGGLTSFSINMNCKVKIFEASVKFYNILILCVATLLDFLMILFLILCQNDLWDSKHNIFVKSRNVESGMPILFFAFVFAVILIAIYEFCKRRYLVKCIELICKVDQSPFCVNSINLKKQKIFLEISIAVSYLVMIYSYVSGYAMMRPMFESDFFTHFFFIVFSKNVINYFFIHMQFILFIVTIKSRYQCINLYLSKMLARTARTYSQAFDKDLIDIAKLHDKLVDVTYYVNKTYGFPVSW